jgi:predicted Fe-S protein YdhL (DUF1289 family)
MTPPIPSPCRNVCRLGADRLCDGCGRSDQEIARWIGMRPEERSRIMARTAAWLVRPATSSTEPRR